MAYSTMLDLEQERRKLRVFLRDKTVDWTYLLLKRLNLSRGDVDQLTDSVLNGDYFGVEHKLLNNGHTLDKIGGAVEYVCNVLEKRIDSTWESCKQLTPEQAYDLLTQTGASRVKSDTIMDTFRKHILCKLYQYVLDRPSAADYLASTTASASPTDACRSDSQDKETQLTIKYENMKAHYEETIRSLHVGFGIKESRIREECQQRIRELENSRDARESRLRDDYDRRIRELEARESRTRIEYERRIRELEARESNVCTEPATSSTPELCMWAEAAIKAALDQLPLGSPRTDLRMKLARTGNNIDVKYHKLFGGKDDIALACYICGNLEYNTVNRLRQLQGVLGQVHQGASAEYAIREWLDRN